MRKKLLNNLGLKLASLVLACVIWFLVVQFVDPKESETFYNVPVNLVNTELLEQEGKVYEVLDDTDKVRVTVYAPRSIIQQLRETDILAEADMSRLTDINTIAITYEVPNAEVTSIVGNHEVVRLSVENKKSKWIRLVGNTMGDVAEGYIVSNSYLDQTNIEISGPESVVSLVDHARVNINVAGAMASLSANIDIELYDAEGNKVEQKNIKKNVDSAHMTVEVLATKDVPVRVSYTGVPEDGYLETGVVESSITNVKIAGTTSALANINSITIPAERVDITDATTDVVEVINLKEYLADNIKFADKTFDGKTTVTVYVEPIVEKELLIPAYNITLRNLPEGFVAEMPTDVENYSLMVSGLREYTDPLQQNQIVGTIDIVAWMAENELEELRPGTYEMPVTFGLSEDITIETPVNVIITIKNLEEE